MTATTEVPKWGIPQASVEFFKDMRDAAWFFTKCFIGIVILAASAIFVYSAFVLICRIIVHFGS